MFIVGRKSRQKKLAYFIFNLNGFFLNSYIFNLPFNKNYEAAYLDKLWNDTCVRAKKTIKKCNKSTKLIERRISNLLQSTPRAVHQERCSPTNHSWLARRLLLQYYQAWIYQAHIFEILYTFVIINENNKITYNRPKRFYL